MFAEERALEHVRVLSEEIGFRQVSTPGLKLAAEYLEKECRKLVDYIEKHRPDLEAEVDIEMVSGSIIDQIFKHDLINVYRNLTNIVLFIQPKTARDQKAFLINAHFDSALGSPGAADCASCVGVGLETVRALVEGDFPFHSPILLLLNGGEETLLQAAHGFITQSKWKDRVGAFVNLESTGSGGSSLLFQYTSSWALETYASGAAFPRGLVLAQEFFESGVIPADTDFRIFSMNHHGSYPGIDIATVMDATSYHTDRDTLHRIRSGTTQEYGETVLGLTQSFMKELPDRDLSDEKMVYFDIFHSFLVAFKLKAAYWVYRVPVGLLFIAFDLSENKTEFLKITGFGLLRNILSCLLAAAVPGAFGMLRAFLSGHPMVWFGHHSAAFIFYCPAALLGYLLPTASSQNRNEVSANFTSISILMTSAALFLAYQRIGSSVILLITALTTSLMSLFSQMIKKIPLSLVLLLGFYACTSSSALMIVLVKHVMEKIGMAGAHKTVLMKLAPDAIAGVLNGVIVLLILQVISPLVTFQWTKQTRNRFLKSIFAFTLIMGLFTSFLFPYTLKNPKRVFLVHLCRQQEDLSYKSFWSVASWDVIDIKDLLPEELQNTETVQSSPNDLISFKPFNKALQGVVFPGPSMSEPGPWGEHYPHLDLKKKIVDVERHSKRLYLELVWDRPGWGAMVLIGPIVDWSLSEKNGIRRNETNVVRFAQDVVEPVWPFWIEIEEAGSLEVQLGVYYPTANNQTMQLAKKFPEWTAILAGTSFVSTYTFD